MENSVTTFTEFFKFQLVNFPILFSLEINENLSVL